LEPAPTGFGFGQNDDNKVRNMRTSSDSHTVTKKTLIIVWAALVVLTGVTITVARIHLGFGNVIAALTLATIKASLVILFFMDLRHEEKIIRNILLVTLFVLVIFIGLAYFDVGFRYNGQ
jgi:cytochrome c oxidase subunit IV